MGKIRKKDIENQSSSLMIKSALLLIVMMFCYFGLMSKGTYSATTLVCPSGGYVSVSDTKCCLSGYTFNGSNCQKRMCESTLANCQQNCSSGSCSKSGEQYCCTSSLSAQNKIEKTTCDYTSASACQSATGYLCYSNSSGCYVPNYSAKLNTGCYKCSKSNNNYSLQWSSVEVSGCSKVDVAQSSCSGTYCNEGYELKDGSCVKKEEKCYACYFNNTDSSCTSGIGRKYYWNEQKGFDCIATTHDKDSCLNVNTSSYLSCLTDCPSGYTKDNSGKCIKNSVEKDACYKCSGGTGHTYKWSSTAINGCREIDLPESSCNGTYCNVGYELNSDGVCVSDTDTSGSSWGNNQCVCEKTAQGAVTYSCDTVRDASKDGTYSSFTEMCTNYCNQHNVHYIADTCLGIIDGDSTGTPIKPSDSNPGTPGGPTTPSEPDDPDTPDNPSEPSNPSNPDSPSNPSNPDTPNTPDKDENVTENPKTGSVAIFMVWVMTLATLGYAFWYFKNAKYE